MKVILKPDPTIEELIFPQEKEKQVRYIPSQFAVPLQYERRTFVFHTLTRQCIEGELPPYAYCGGEYDDLIESMYLVPEGTDECGYYSYVFNLVNCIPRSKRVQSYVILPTLACNARCIYCYEQGMKPVTMSEDTVKQTIRYILSRDISHLVSLSWFGGEPFMCPEIIDTVCSALKDSGVHFRSKGVSNGSLITPEIIEKMKGLWNLKQIQISMDGCEEDYRNRKNYVLYDHTYEKVLNNICLLSRAGINVLIRCNVDKDNWARIPQFVDDIQQTVSDITNVSLYFALLFDARKDNSGMEMFQKIMDMDSLLEGAGLRDKDFDFSFRSRHCMADAGAVVIGPDGSLYPCEHCPDKGRYGDVWNGVTDPSAEQTYRRTDHIREKCLACPFLPDCTGYSTCPNDEANCREHRQMILRHQFIKWFRNQPL